MTYSISEVAKKTGLSNYTIRYYEKQGLLPLLKYSSTGRRMFSDSDVEYIMLILCLKETGMSIKELSRFSKLIKQNESNKEKIVSTLLRQKKAMENKIKQDTKILEILKSKIYTYESSIN